MSENVQVSSDLWRDVKQFFTPLVAPCKDCLRGNAHSCWHSECKSFRFRNIARRIEAVSDGGISKPCYARVEDEILSALAMYGRPVPPAYIHLETTNSKANKHSAIKRLVRMGLVVRLTLNGCNMISLPNKELENENTESTNDAGGEVSRSEQGVAVA